MDLTALLHNFAPHLEEAIEQGNRRLTSPPAPGDRERPTDWRPQRQLTPTQSVELVRAYRDGETVAALSRRFDINRCTVHEHLDRAGVVRLPPTPTLSPAQIHEAATLYSTGLSLIAVGQHFNVNPTTMATHLKRAGHQLRPRRGWPTGGKWD